MGKYEELKFTIGKNLDECIETLLDYNKQGKFAFCNFNGHKFYSDKITMDGAYMKVLGKTKSDFDKYIENMIKKNKKDTEDHILSIPILAKGYMDKGRLILDKKHIQAWDEVVIKALHGIYRGFDIECALIIMEKLNSGESFKSLKKLTYNQGHSGGSMAITMAIVKEFSAKGNEFFEYINKNQD